MKSALIDLLLTNCQRFSSSNIVEQKIFKHEERTCKLQ